MLLESSGCSNFFCFTLCVRPGCDNVLAVHVDATAPDGWWYDGGGIYRHVWLTTVSPASCLHKVGDLGMSQFQEE